MRHGSVPKLRTLISNEIKSWMTFSMPWTGAHSLERCWSRCVAAQSHCLQCRGKCAGERRAKFDWSSVRRLSNNLGSNHPKMTYLYRLLEGKALHSPSPSTQRQHEHRSLPGEQWHLAMQLLFDLARDHVEKDWPNRHSNIQRERERITSEIMKFAHFVHIMFSHLKKGRYIP